MNKIATIYLFHPTGMPVAIDVRFNTAAGLMEEIDGLITGGFCHTRIEKDIAKAIITEPMTRERLDAAARGIAAAANAEELDRIQREHEEFCRRKREKELMDQAKADAKAEREKAEPNLDRAKENMAKLDKAESKPDEAEKQRVAQLLATWKHFLFVKDGGPNAVQATETTRELIDNEPNPVIQHIWKHAISKWASETGFEWDKGNRAWVAPKDEGPEPEQIPW